MTLPVIQLIFCVRLPWPLLRKSCAEIDKVYCEFLKISNVLRDKDLINDLEISRSLKESAGSSPGTTGASLKPTDVSTGGAVGISGAPGAM